MPSISEILIFLPVVLFIAWIWIDYYRLIDLYEKDALPSILLTFFLGCLSPFLVLQAQVIVPFLQDERLNGEWVNDLTYFVFNVGLVEEIAKTLFFLLAWFLLRSRINESIDIIAYSCITALGFAATENMLYFVNHGPVIIVGRAVLATISHMIDGAIIGYGFVLYKYHPKGQKWWILPGYLSAAAIIHGLYDFIITATGGGVIMYLSIGTFFLLTISIFSTILNNGLNNSSYFSYHRAIDSTRLSKKMILYYVTIIAIQGILIAIFFGFNQAILQSTVGELFVFFIVFITIMRISRFTLIRGYWEAIRLELPMRFNHNGRGMEIRGNPYNDAQIQSLVEKDVLFIPLGKYGDALNGNHYGHIGRKHFLSDLTGFWKVIIYDHELGGTAKSYVIMPKTTGDDLMHEKYPIVGLFHSPELGEEDITTLDLSHFEIIQWAYIMPVEGEESKV
jgi:RsiW-degrading membrane proteinase PrsW (M82 family)